MRIITTPEAIRTECRHGRQQGGGLGFVPTMGALHRGHLALVEAARRENRATAVSIFVNPTQFGPGEDYARYPRQLEKDASMLERAGVDLLFAPHPEAVYPPGDATAVLVEGLSERLCGASRPGHFRGVATVVLKLLHLVQPDRAYFGQKDAVQVAVLRRMVCDLHVDVTLAVCPIVRDEDGLALSSRNAYLSPAERRTALALVRGLRALQAAAERGETDCARLLGAARAVLAEQANLRLDYLEAVDENDLLPRPTLQPGLLFAVAAWVGTTRLIDNAHADASGRVLL